MCIKVFSGKYVRGTVTASCRANVQSRQCFVVILVTTRILLIVSIHDLFVEYIARQTLKDSHWERRHETVAAMVPALEPDIASMGGIFSSLEASNRVWHTAR